ncbi:MAG: nucleotide exchange factor GrpE [Planctomycetia bacterium]|nr:nucleotide exchange factor GrpE [Planctomycetia bacterium]
MSHKRTDRLKEGDVIPASPTEAAPESAADAALEASEVEIAKLRTDLEDASDRVLRAQAELDNYRKRVRREMEDERRYASLSLLRDLLPVLDNINRAIAAAEKSPNGGSLLEGVKMIGQNLQSVLARHNCSQIDALHHPFDPAFHQAISQQPTADHPPNTVVLVAQDGYVLYDRVVRPSQVIVSTTPASE